MKLIKFRRLNKPINYIEPYSIRIEHWEIAFDEKDLERKLNGDMAEIIMPAKPLYVRLWRKLFPLKFITREVNHG